MNGVVYFVRAASGDIKIGTTRRLRTRLNDLSSGIPGGCELLAATPGGRALERQLHSQLAEHRIGNEWFRPAPAVVALAEQYAAAGVVATEERQQSPEDAAFIADMRRWVRLCACPAIVGEPVPNAIERAAERLGFSVGRVTSLWYGKGRDISAIEAAAVRRCAIRHCDDVSFLREEVARVHGELAVLGTAIERLVPEIGAARDMARDASGPGSHRANGDE